MYLMQPEGWEVEEVPGVRGDGQVSGTALESRVVAGERGDGVGKVHRLQVNRVLGVVYLPFLRAGDLEEPVG